MSESPEENNEGQVENSPVDEGRREFLNSLGKWSGASVLAVVGAAGWMSTPGCAYGATWVNRRHGGGWVNRGGSWVNRGGGWINRGGGWVNRGGGGWVNRRGGGGWINRR